MSDGLLRTPSQHSTLKNIVTLSKLTSFHYDGHGVFFDAIVAGLSAPFLLDLSMALYFEIMSLTVHPLRFISETEEQCHSVQVSFCARKLRLSLINQSGHHWLSFTFFPKSRPFQELMMRMSSDLITKLITAEDLYITLERAVAEDDI
jgi:hypothetical protein